MVKSFQNEQKSILNTFSSVQCKWSYKCTDIFKNVFECSSKANS